MPRSGLIFRPLDHHLLIRIALRHVQTRQIERANHPLYPYPSYVLRTSSSAIVRDAKRYFQNHFAWQLKSEAVVFPARRQSEGCPARRSWCGTALSSDWPFQDLGTIVQFGPMRPRRFGRRCHFWSFSGPLIDAVDVGEQAVRPPDAIIQPIIDSSRRQRTAMSSSLCCQDSALGHNP